MSKHSRNTLWNPWYEMMNWDRTLGSLFNNMTEHGDFPPTNAWTSPEKLTFTFEMPAMKAEDIEVSAKPDTLTIKGTRLAETLPEGAEYVRQERGAGTFARSFGLPYKIDPDAVEASYINGILTVTLPKAHEVQPRKICIASN